MNILDIFLLPKSFYKRITDKKTTLYIGILLVGLIDLVFPVLENSRRIFSGKPPAIMFFNITLTLLLMLLIGFVDIIFFSFPLFDLFKFFKRGKKPHDSSQLTRLMKVYIVVNLLIFPVNLIIYLLSRNAGVNTYVILAYVVIIIIFWSAAALARGISTIYEFDPIFVRLSFLVIFTWGYILSYAIEYILSNWLLILFR